MNYGKIDQLDIANGPGVRVSLYVSGCRNHCKGCFNPKTWNFNYGKPFTMETCKEIIISLLPVYVSGLTILGGDPFEPENIGVVTSLCKDVSMIHPDKTIWIYTGYKYDDFKDHEIMDYINVLVDGPFIENLKDITLQFRGSSNQRIIDVRRSKLENKVVIWEYGNSQI